MVEPKEQYKNIESYTIARYKQDFILKLDMNENTLGCSPHVTSLIQSLTPDEFSKYPTYGEVEEKIAKFFSLKTEQVLITNGGDAGINCTYSAYVSENDEVIYTVPSYVMYKLDAIRRKAKIVQVTYDEKWVYPTEKVLAAITDKTKMIVICSPSNPTGELVAEKDICRICEKAPHAMILLDEAYWRFANREPKSLSHLINRYDNITIMHTFSKDYGLAGIRIGYLLSNPTNLQYIHRSMDPFAVNNVAVEAAKAAIDDQEFVLDYVNKMNEGKKYFNNAIKSISKEVYDTHANFSFFYVGPQFEFYFAKLMKHNIKIRRYPNNPILEGYLRPTMGSVEQMKKLLTYFEDYETIILDIDGVLIDESISYRRAIQETVKHFTDMTITQEEIQEIKNTSGFIDDWLLSKYFIEKHGKTITMDEVVDKFQEIYFNDGKGLISYERLLLDPAMIIALSKKYKMGIFTGRPEAEARFILEKEGIIDCFDIMVCADNVPEGKGKPDCWGLNKICDYYNTRKAIYFGDMPDDMLAASSAKIDSIGILPPQDKSENLKQLLLNKGAIEVYNTLESAIPKVFGYLEN